MSTPLPPVRDITIPTRDGKVLRGRYWTWPEPRGVLVVAHGLGEHGGCYRHVAEALAPALAIDVVAADFRGHGRSPGRRGVVRRYEDLTADCRAMLDWVEHQRPGLPRFLLGHSNGGQVALRIALEGKAELAGLILSNPSIQLATPVPPNKLRMGRILLRVAPRVTLSAILPADQLTHDPAMQREHRADPLRHSRISPPLFFGMVDGGHAIAHRAAEILLPLLMILGEDDPIVDAGYSRRVFERFGSPDKTLKVYRGMLHEPLNELGREQVIEDIERWLANHLSPVSRSLPEGQIERSSA